MPSFIFRIFCAKREVALGTIQGQIDLMNFFSISFVTFFLCAFVDSSKDVIIVLLVNGPSSHVMKHSPHICEMANHGLYGRVNKVEDAREPSVMLTAQKIGTDYQNPIWELTDGRTVCVEWDMGFLEAGRKCSHVVRKFLISFWCEFIFRLNF